MTDDPLARGDDRRPTLQNVVSEVAVLRRVQKAETDCRESIMSLSQRVDVRSVGFALVLGALAVGAFLYVFQASGHVTANEATDLLQRHLERHYDESMRRDVRIERLETLLLERAKPNGGE